jgi:hypothetical protein
MNSLKSLGTPNLQGDTIALKQKRLKPSHLQDSFPTNWYGRGLIVIGKQLFAFLFSFLKIEDCKVCTFLLATFQL